MNGNIRSKTLKRLLQTEPIWITWVFENTSILTLNLNLLCRNLSCYRTYWNKEEDRLRDVSWMMERQVLSSLTSQTHSAVFTALSKLGKHFNLRGKLFLHLNNLLSKVCLHESRQQKGQWIESDIGTSTYTFTMPCGQQAQNLQMIFAL